MPPARSQEVRILASSRKCGGKAAGSSKWQMSLPPPPCSAMPTGERRRCRRFFRAGALLHTALYGRRIAAAATNIHEPWALRCGIQNKKRCLPKLSSLPTEAPFEKGLGGRQSALRAYRATLEMMSLLARRFWVQLVWPCCISSFGPSFISKCA